MLRKVNYLENEEKVEKIVFGTNQDYNANSV